MFWGIFICFFSTRLLYSGVLGTSRSRDERGSWQLPLSEVEASQSPPTLLAHQDAENGYGLQLSLFKELPSHSHQKLRDRISRPQPDSTALRYMKRLYRMFATKGGIPKPSKSHLYNTVRLVTPHAECEHLSKNQERGDLHSVDLLFNLDYVTTLEHLFKSVLLYSFDRPVSKSLAITCTCNLLIREHVASSQVCPNISHAVTFNLHVELGRKWVEIDVTTFLQPLIASGKKSIHIAVNFTCLKNDETPSYNMARLSPSLLLFLNDTSQQAHHQWNFLKHKRMKPALFKQKKSLNEEARKNLKQGKRAPRHRREAGGKVENTPSPIYDLSQYYRQYLFPQNECELHNFWLRFSQLKWNRWIIAPRKYNPRYCKGECPRVVRHRYGSPVHTVVQNIIYEKLDSSVPRPSCIPAEYRPLSVLKMEPDRSIVYKEYDNMIATKCTCR
uniref:Growth differentiation factor 9 n=2 Tax=Varanus komodoensis TaxID=61221 RepID=A0A8D2L5I9_VARKO